MRRQIITGLDIGTSQIRIVVCEYKKGNPIPEVLALVRKPSRGLRRGYVIQSEEASNSIHEGLAEAERVAGVKIKNVLLAVGGITVESKIADGNVIISRAGGEIGEIDLNRVAEASEQTLGNNLTNSSVIHRIPLAYKLDNKKILGRPEGMRGNKLEVRTLFVTSSTQHLNDLIGVVENAGAHVDDVIASPLAASFSTLTKIQKNAGCVLANIGSQTTSIAIFEDGIPISLQIFPIGSTDITNDIALGFQIPLEDAERIKKGESEPGTTRKKLDQIIDARLSDVFELIETHLKKIGRNGLLPAGVVITGGGSGIDHIEQLAKNHFKLPAKVAGATILSSSHNQIKDISWSVAYGLCLFGSDMEAEESTGQRLFKNTKHNFVKWLKELLP
jgi:cell division protein FtsA